MERALNLNAPESSKWMTASRTDCSASWSPCSPSGSLTAALRADSVRVHPRRASLSTWRVAPTHASAFTKALSCLTTSLLSERTPSLKRRLGFGKVVQAALQFRMPLKGLRPAKLQTALIFVHTPPSRLPQHSLTFQCTDLYRATRVPSLQSSRRYLLVVPLHVHWHTTAGITCFRRNKASQDRVGSRQQLLNGCR